jgi:hypothetical protein
MMRRRRLIIACLSVTALSVSTASAAVAATWVTVPAQAVGTQSTLGSLDLVSSTDGWAVGSSATNGGLVERWNGQRFAVVSSPDILPAHDGSASAGLGGIDVLTSTSAFAVGSSSFYGSDGLAHKAAVAERWNGSTWTRMAVPSKPVNGSFSRVKAFSATDAWAVGRAGDTFSSATLAMHWNGTAWSPVGTPSPGTRDNVLTSLAGSGPNDVWAVGYYKDLPYGNRVIHPLALHWNGSAWSRVSVPDVGPIVTILRDVVVLSSTNAWAVGYASGGINGTTGAVLHWNGSSWSVASSPALGSLNSVAAVSAGDIWVTGTTSGDGKLAVSNWRGSTWTTSQVPLTGSPPSAGLTGTTVVGTTVFGVGYTSDPDTGASSPLAVRGDNG